MATTPSTRASAAAAAAVASAPAGMISREPANRSATAPQIGAETSPAAAPIAVNSPIVPRSSPRSE